MFCPKCKDEFREGFNYCTRCQVDLVEKIPVESQAEPVNEQELRLCKSCGAPLPADEVVCTECKKPTNVRSLTDPIGILQAELFVSNEGL